MIRTFTILFSLLFFSLGLSAQVSINFDGASADGSAMLDVKSTDKGFLPPRMTQAQRDGISSAAVGLLVYQTDGTPGYYYFTGTNWIGITSSASTSLIDADGNVYPTTTIGNQVWMAKNLHVTHYRNGDAIPNVTDPTAWGGLSTGAYCWYSNDQGNSETYGFLYNWYTVDESRGLCPEGWHVPTNDEWTTLTTFLGGTTIAGGKLKATSNLWASPNTDATNSSHCSGLPGGYRWIDGSFSYNGSYGFWWSSTEFSADNAWYRNLDYQFSSVLVLDFNKQSGFSIRCLRD